MKKIVVLLFIFSLSACLNQSKEDALPEGFSSSGNIVRIENGEDITWAIESEDGLFWIPSLASFYRVDGMEVIFAYRIAEDIESDFQNMPAIELLSVAAVGDESLEESADEVTFASGVVFSEEIDGVTMWFIQTKEGIFSTPNLSSAYRIDQMNVNFSYRISEDGGTPKVNILSIEPIQ